MSVETIGLSDIALHLPDPHISIERIVAERVKEDPQLEKHLDRALKVTGQRGLRFTKIYEDTATLAAQACLNLAQRGRLKRDHVRFLTIGTETGVDMSKAASSYVLGMMEKAGFPLPKNLSTFQVQHACAGGTLSMITVAGFLQAASLNGDTAVVLTSDIARYPTPSTAEITQGAGATALMIKRNPDLITFDLGSVGFFSKDTDDFFRPLGSPVAMVKGGYSVQCYHESLIGAFEDHCERLGVSPAAELESIDIFALHVPYSLLPVGAMEKLLSKYLGLDKEAADAFLRERGFFQSVYPTSEVGNIYTGSLFLGLAWSLKERHEQLGAGIVGKKVMMASYGSGNTMAVLTGRVAPNAPEIIRGWDLDQLLQRNYEASFEEYLEWTRVYQPSGDLTERLERDQPKPGRFYLNKLRDDGYREYGFRA
ncbi:MAG: hydroxymethylglutaryl-CoA synthase [Armatimonadota bacterium]|nr:hydroxymethylglutaryl-CoA synthase [Armatimonadota bacterium]